MKRKPKTPPEYRKGFVEFLGSKIDLSKRSFIPRVETEYWVKKAIKEIKQSKVKSQNLKILDMFAGSGCIGISVLKACPELCRRVDFVDIDKKAISQIKINLKINKIPSERCRVFHSDLFSRLKGKTYDVIFANPPYVAKERIKEVEKSALEYEPKMALFSGRKGLNHIKRFLREAKRFLNEKGLIYLEFDPLQKKDIEMILEKHYKKYRFFRDQFRKYRWLRIRVEK